MLSDLLSRAAVDVFSIYLARHGNAKAHSGSADLPGLETRLRRGLHALGQGRLAV
jgi:hypothetical protein